MKNLLLILFLCASFPILNSCSTKNFQCVGFYENVNKSTTNAQFVQNYKKSITRTLDLTVDNEVYTLYFTDMFISNSISRTSQNISYGNGLGTKTTYMEDYRYEKAIFCFAFKNNRYVYSGYLYEFKRNTDEKIKELGSTISQFLSKETK